jgi:hypothetical protein
MFSHVRAGDLKPDNILIKDTTSATFGFVAKVSDFGLSVLMQVGKSAWGGCCGGCGGWSGLSLEAALGLLS